VVLQRAAAAAGLALHEEARLPYAGTSRWLALYSAAPAVPQRLAGDPR
jgi:hypothetical protein